MLRDNHYDRAFEEYLRDRRTPYVAVDETRRATMEDVSLKSMDFIVYSSRTPNLLIDVKGRRFPSGRTAAGRWQNWAMADDVAALIRWQEVFGGGFRSALVFAYEIVERSLEGDFLDAFTFRDRVYAFYGVWIDDYVRDMRIRSPRWGTVCLPSRSFHELRTPVAELL